jgi:long-chain acyl-CoA synthetase
MSGDAAHVVEYDYVWENSYPDSLSWAQEFVPQPLTSILEQACNKFAERPAISFGDRTFTYKELWGLTEKIACGLQDLGVKKGVKVGMFLPNTPYFVAFYYGILKAGGTVVNYNPLYVEREIINQVEDSETDYLVTLDVAALLDKSDAVMKSSRLKGIIVCPTGIEEQAQRGEEFINYNELIDNEGQYNSVTINPKEDVAVLQYTGGTTGVPKGAMLTHANLYINAMQIAMWHSPKAVEGQDKIVGVLPLFHVFAMTVVMNMALHLGMEIVLVSKFDPEEFIPMLKEKKPNFIPAVPAIFNAIVSHPLSKGLDLSAVKFCLSGGAPLPGEVKKSFEENTNGVIGEGYGLTEASPVVTCNPLQGQIKLGSIGLPLPGTLVEILSIEDGKTVMPVGEHGEVCVSGPQVMKGYFNKPEETGNTIKNGRLHTGDVGYIDQQGYVHLIDRLKDVILVRGYNVYPTQVEEAIYMHDSVEECIVAGVPDDERGETVWAWVKTLDGKALDEAELIEFLKDKISPIEIPRRVIIKNEALPKTAVGKLSRKLLLEQEGVR